MRLRPSGRSGPLATQIDGFASYQQNEAWTWEHMALTRARVVSASPAFAARVEKLIRAVLCRPRDAEVVAGDVVEMRRAIATEKGDDQRWNLKYVAGGLVDIEFIAQYLQLIHASQTPDILDTSTARVLEKAWRLGVLSTEDAEVLRPAVRLYDDLTQILRLCLSGPFDPSAAAPGLIGLLARAADVPEASVEELSANLTTGVPAELEAPPGLHGDFQGAAGQSPMARTPSPRPPGSLTASRRCRSSGSVGTAPRMRTVGAQGSAPLLAARAAKVVGRPSLSRAFGVA